MIYIKVYENNIWMRDRKEKNGGHTREYTTRNGGEKETTGKRKERENGPAGERKRKEESYNKIGARTGGETR